MEAPPEAKKPSTLKRKIIIGATLLFVLGVGIWSFLHTRHSNPIPTAIQQSLTFTLPHPTALPSGYRLDQHSFSAKNNVLTFTASNSTQEKLAFSIQARPQTFDFDSFYSKGLSGSFTFSTPLGEAAIGSANNQIIGSLVTADSWILVTSSSQVKNQELQTILKNMK